MKTVPPLAKDSVPPQARREPVRRSVHGVELVDEYDWIRASNWQEVLKKPKALPAEIRDLVLAEKKYAADVLAPTKSLQRALVKEMRARIKEDDADVPVEDGPFAYYERYREGGEHEIVCRRPRAGGDESVLVDGDELARGKAFFELGDAAHAPDHAKLAWSVDEQGSEYHTIRVRDLATGADLDSIADTEGGSSGPPTRAPSTTCASTTITAPIVFTCTCSARRPTAIVSSTRRATPHGSSVSGKPSRAPSR